MKKVIFIMALAFGMMSFTDSNKKVSISNTFETENTFIEEGPCRWRFCTIKEGVKTCSEWTYGYCFPGFEI